MRQIMYSKQGRGERILAFEEQLQVGARVALARLARAVGVNGCKVVFVLLLLDAQVAPGNQQSAETL